MDFPAGPEFQLRPGMSGVHVRFVFVDALRDHRSVSRGIVMDVAAGGVSCGLQVTAPRSARSTPFDST